ncbi:MAG TPA: type I phosphomannose isomerase catalytic subunit [Chloroflexota bacterium]|nr:type I phosphomannose isomerase catalytic subunit [Chloroflexota bacterium]
MSEQPIDRPYPLKLSPIPVERVWGGDKLKGLVDRAPSGPVGELWVVWGDLEVENGPWQGKPLRELVAGHPQAILGGATPALADALFPLLVKLIDARETLSVQVHPDDMYALSHEHQLLGKSEMWYVLDAEPNARIVHGLNRAVTPDELRQALTSGTLGELLNYVPVTRGDTVIIPAGTIHALGEGTMVYELQQSSDLTYRLFDWNRKPVGGVRRELHVDKSLDVARLDPIANHKVRSLEIKENGYLRRFLAACSYFAAELLTVQSPVTLRPSNRFQIVTVLDGAITLLTKQGDAGRVNVQSMGSALIPAAVDEYEIRPAGDEATVLKGYVPDLRRDVMEPLLAAGFAMDDILQLGGDPDRSDLKKAMGSDKR